VKEQLKLHCAIGALHAVTCRQLEPAVVRWWRFILCLSYAQARTTTCKHSCTHVCCMLLTGAHAHTHMLCRLPMSPPCPLLICCRRHSKHTCPLSRLLCAWRKHTASAGLVHHASAVKQNAMHCGEREWRQANEER
jgi:hypothetical protein